MANPLDAFVAQKKPVNLRLPDMPRYAAMAERGTGLATILGKIDQANAEWKQQVERQLASLGSTSQTTTVTTVATAPAVPGASTGSTSGLQADLSALADKLNKHIASHIVHGTTSEVVGESDEQPLDSKTIGFNAERNAKFRHVLSYSRIDLGEEFVIPVNFNMIVAGEFIVDGLLTIEGAFASVT